MWKQCALQLKQQAKNICAFSTSTSMKSTKRLGIIGVPFSKGQTKQGVEKGPTVLREHGLVELIKNASQGNLTVTDYGNLKYTADPDDSDAFRTMKNYGEFMGCNKALIAKVQEILKDNDQFLTIGGDHAIGFGSVSGHLLHTPNLSLVWVDAHADINLHNTSDTGNIHGMPVSLLLKELRNFWKNANLNEIAPNCLAVDQLIYIGLRDVDPYEKFILNKLGIRAYAMDSVDRYGIRKIIEMTLDALDSKNKLHVSFDIDALDSVVTPSTGTIVEGGLTLREGISIVEALRDTNRVQGMDIVEFNPLLGTEQDVKTTIKSTFEIVKTMCGYRRAGDSTHINGQIFETEKEFFK